MARNLTDLEVTNIFKDLSALVEDSFAEFKDISDLEVNLAKKGIDDRLSQGFFNNTTLDDQQLLENNLASNDIFTPSEVNTAGVKFNNVLTTLFGGPPAVGDVATSTTSDFASKVSENFQSGFGNCRTGVSAIDTIAGIVDIQSRKIQNVYSGLTSTWGVLTGNEPNLGTAVFIKALQNYLLRITEQNFLLTQIRDEVNNLAEDVQELTADDYSINHKVVISNSIVQLNNADNILRAQLDNVLRNFPINFQGYENAKKNIDNVRDALCGIDLQDLFGGFLNITALKISARLIYLEELETLLLSSDERANRIKVNLGSFDTAYENVTFFDSLLVPVLQLLRCRLAVLQADMKQTADENRLAKFIIKEKEWCLELAILSSLMNAAKIFDIDTDDTPLSVDGVQDVLDSLFTDVKNFDQVVSIDSIALNLEQYIRNVRYKLSFNVPTTQIEARAGLIERLINQRIEENESFGLLVGSRTIGIEGNIATAANIFGSLLGSVRNTEVLSVAAQELEEGNLRGLLNGEILKNSLLQSYNEILGGVEDALESAGCSLLEVGDKSLAAYDIFEDVTRSEALFNDALVGFPEESLQQQVLGEQPRFTS